MMVNLLFYLCLIGFVGIALACRCGIVSEDERFCKAKFAILVKVMNTGTISPDGRDRVYQIEIQSTLKSAFSSSLVDNTHIYTSVQGSLCGSNLRNGQRYLLAGSYKYNSSGSGIKKMYLGLCKIVRELNKTELQQFTAPACTCTAAKRKTLK